MWNLGIVYAALDHYYLTQIHVLEFHLFQSSTDCLEKFAMYRNSTLSRLPTDSIGNFLDLRPFVHPNGNDLYLPYLLSKAQNLNYFQRLVHLKWCFLAQFDWILSCQLA